MGFLWLLSCFMLLGAALGHGAPASHSKITITGRIVNGVNARPGSWPWHLAVLYGDGEVTCGASLISDNWFVTAGHCNITVSTLIAGGLVDRRTDWRIAQVLKVARVFQHPSYNENSALNDITLVKLATPANFSERVSPVRLPRAGDIFQPRTPCVITGYGFPNPKVIKTASTLQQAPIPLLPLADCRRYWGTEITDDYICAGASGVGISKGDSGGALVCQKDGAWTLVCTLSRTSLHSLTYKPFVCHRITSLLPWIEETMAKS